MECMIGVIGEFPGHLNLRMHHNLRVEDKHNMQWPHDIWPVLVF